jgi:hypothetical protein
MLTFLLLFFGDAGLSSQASTFFFFTPLRLPMDVLPFFLCCRPASLYLDRLALIRCVPASMLLDYLNFVGVNNIVYITFYFIIFVIIIVVIHPLSLQSSPLLYLCDWILFIP